MNRFRLYRAKLREHPEGEWVRLKDYEYLLSQLRRIAKQGEGLDSAGIYTKGHRLEFAIIIAEEAIKQAGGNAP